MLELADKGQAMQLLNAEKTTEAIGEDKAWNYFRDLICGLDYRKCSSLGVTAVVHAQNIVHRDIKPGIH